MKTPILWLDRLAAFVAGLGEALAALAVVGMFIHISLEIMMRFFFSTSTFVLDEFVGYMVATLIFSAAANCLRTGSHLRVGMIIDRLGITGRRVAEAAALLLLLFVAILLTRYYAAAALRAWDRGTVSQTIAQVPLWLPLSVIAFCVANLALQGFSRLAMLATGEFRPEEMIEGPGDV